MIITKSYRDIKKQSDFSVTAKLDIDAIVYRLAARALGNKTGRASAMGGSIKVKINRKEKP